LCFNALILNTKDTKGCTKVHKGLFQCPLFTKRSEVEVKETYY